ncbi:MAG TPA: ANTAR domain-containing protein [Kutzneria sp.]|nr:ANTAR domain-containing protein [Kutzneria sp.]
MLQGGHDLVPTRMLARFAGDLAAADSRARFVRVVTDLPRRVLGVPAVGVLLADADGVLVTGGSPDQERFAELFAGQASGGPVLECLRAGQPVVLSRDGALAQGRHDLAAAMSAAGVTAVDAVPLRVRRVVVGAIALFLDTMPSSSFRRRSQLVQVVAALGLTAHELDRDLRATADTVVDLTEAVVRRAKIEQATGVLAERRQVTIDDAASMLREDALVRRLSVHEAALEILAGRNDLFG